MILTNAKVVTHDDVFLGTVEINEAGLIQSVSEGISTLPQAMNLEGD